MPGSNSLIFLCISGSNSLVLMHALGQLLDLFVCPGSIHWFGCMPGSKSLICMHVQVQRLDLDVPSPLDVFQHYLLCYWIDFSDMYVSGSGVRTLEGPMVWRPWGSIWHLYLMWATNKNSYCKTTIDVSQSQSWPGHPSKLRCWPHPFTCLCMPHHCRSTRTPLIVATWLWGRPSFW